MTPLELKQRHKLSYSKLAILLQRDQRTVERYCAGGKCPEYLLTYCYLLDDYLQRHSNPPPTCWGWVG